jgi:hypothetical protein
MAEKDEAENTTGKEATDSKLTGVSFLFLYHYYSNISDTTTHIISARFSHCIILQYITLLVLVCERQRIGRNG